MIVADFARRSTWMALAIALGLPWLVAGCGQSQQIRAYSVPKEAEPQAAAAAPVATGEATHRMLAAILPAEGQAWFFKAVAPLADIDKHADAINKFFAAVRLGEDGKAKWELPSGWQEQGPTQFRAATILIPTEGKPVEISVTQLPWTGSQQDVLANINRWRGQMQLPAIGERELPETTSEVKAGDATMTLVDLRGSFQGGPMMGPFAGGAPGRAAPNPSADLPAGHPPVDSTTSAPRDGAAPPAADDLPKFAAPAAWKPAPASQFRKAAFEVTDGAQKALVTIGDFRLDSGPMIADPLSNVNRWRQEIGLAPIEKDALESTFEAMEIGGQPAKYVRNMPDTAKTDESRITEASLAAMVTSGDRIWFFKMKGDRDLVAAQENDFKNFLKSVRFAADAGAPDGNK